MWFFLSQLRTYGPWLIISSLIIAVTIMHYHLQVAVSNYELEKVKLNNLDQLVQQQNTAIIQWKKASEAQTNKIDKVNALIAKQQNFYQEKLKLIMDSKVNSDCQDAMSWANQEANNLSQSW